MKLNTLIEGYQRLCECKNGSSDSSKYRVISFPICCNHKFVRSISLKVLMGI